MFSGGIERDQWHELGKDPPVGLRHFWYDFFRAVYVGFLDYLLAVFLEADLGLLQHPR